MKEKIVFNDGDEYGQHIAGTIAVFCEEYGGGLPVVREGGFGNECLDFRSIVHSAVWWSFRSHGWFRLAAWTGFRTRNDGMLLTGILFGHGAER